MTAESFWIDWEPTAGLIRRSARCRYSSTVVGDRSSATNVSQRANNSATVMSASEPEPTSVMSAASSRCASRLVPWTLLVLDPLAPRRGRRRRDAPEKAKSHIC